MTVSKEQVSDTEEPKTDLDPIGFTGPITLHRLQSIPLSTRGSDLLSLFGKSCLVGATFWLIYQTPLPEEIWRYLSGTTVATARTDVPASPVKSTSKQQKRLAIPETPPQIMPVAKGSVEIAGGSVLPSPEPLTTAGTVQRPALPVKPVVKVADTAQKVMAQDLTTRANTAEPPPLANSNSNSSASAKQGANSRNFPGYWGSTTDVDSRFPKIVEDERAHSAKKSD